MKHLYLKGEHYGTRDNSNVGGKIF